MKSPAHFPILFLVVSAIAFWGWNYFHLLEIRKAAREGIWYEEKVSKAELMQVREPRPEIVFVGASRTQNQINTQTLSERGLSSFNLGVPSTFREDFPFMVGKAAETATTAVVILIPVNQLFKPPGCPKHVTFADAAFVLSHIEENTLGCVGQYFDVAKESLLMNRFKESQMRRENGLATTPQEINRLNKLVNLNLDQDPRGINYIRSIFPGGTFRSVVLFGNGDGQIIGNQLVNRRYSVRRVDRRSESFHPFAIRHLKELIDIVEQHEKKAIVVVTMDLWQMTYVIDVETLAGRLAPADLIYLGNLKLAKNTWADHRHLGHEGVQIFTDHLYEKISILLSD